jgi:hypothetical protein
MLKVSVGWVAAVLVGAAFAGCAPTSHRFVTGPDGQQNVKIKCKTSASHKCTRRAEEVCGTYVTVEQLHLDPTGEIESTMTVRCNPPPPVPSLADLQSGKGSGQAPPATAPSGDAGPASP